MVPEVLDGLLWLARAGLRAARAPVRAGHGYLDPHYRPPGAPYVSVVGPLDLGLEPERDQRLPAYVVVQIPGGTIGRPLPGGTVIPAGTLTVEADVRARATVGPIAGGALDTAGVGATIAAALQTALRAAAWTDLDGIALTDPDDLADLQQVLCRYDAVNRRFAVFSGRSGEVADAAPSALRVVGGSLATALGFDEDAIVADGRLHRIEQSPLRAFAVRTRVDVWASDPRDLGVLSDGLARAVPTRGILVSRPALLADDVVAGARTLRLLDEGEPTTGYSLSHLEAAGGFTDRVGNRVAALTTGASAVAVPPRLRFAGRGTATLPVNPGPFVPDPRRPAHPAPRGWAATIGFSWTGNPANGATIQLLSLKHGNRVALGIAVEIRQVNGDRFADIVGTAQTAAGATASATARLPLARVAAGVVVHAAIESRAGRVHLFADGAPSVASGAAAVVAAGPPAGGDDMALVLGASGGNPVTVDVTHVHVYAEPVGPTDPRLRTQIAGATRFAAGDRVSVALSENGYSATGNPHVSRVVAVTGDTIEIHDPVPGPLARTTSLVYERQLFFRQSQIRRRDDLMNRLVRFSVDFEVSALLDEQARALAPLVERPVVEIVPPVPSGSAAGAGISAASGVPGVFPFEPEFP